MDPRCLGEWVTIHRRLLRADSGPPRVGYEMDQRIHMRGVSLDVHWKLVEVSAPHHAEWEGRGPAHSRARITYRLSGDGEGPTNFDYTNEFNPPGGRLGSLASRVIVGATSEREAHSSLQRLKELLERD